MAEPKANAGGGAEGSNWTLRLAGPQDDSNKSLWAAYSRATGYGPAELIGMVSRRRWLATAGFLTVFLPAAAWVWSMESKYQATASLMIKADLDAISPGQMMAEVESIKGRPALRRVVETIGLAGDGPDASDEENIQRAVSRIEDDVRVGALPQSGVVTIQYSNTDPETAVAVVNTLASLYVDRHESRRRAEEGRESGQDELAVYELELQRARSELADFGQRNQMSLLATQKEAAQARSAQIGADLRRLDGQLREAEAALDQLRGRSGSASAEDLGRAQLEVDSLRNRRGEVVEQLRGAEGWRSELERLTARREKLEAAVAAAEENYIRYQRPEPEPSLAGAGRALTVSLMHRADTASAPAEGGQRPWLLLLSAFAAACAALGVAVLYEPSQRPVSHVADITVSVGAPVLMMIEENQSHVS